MKTHKGIKQAPQDVDFGEFLNRRWRIYGVDGNVFILRQKGFRTTRLFKALEDETDGYRSSLDRVQEITGTEAAATVVCPQIPVAEVRVEEVDEQKGFSGLRFIDVKDEHVWLEVGTNYSADYYPSFEFTFFPKAPS